MAVVQPSDILKRLMAASSTGAIETALSGFQIASPDEYQRDYGGHHIGTWREGFLHWLPVGLDRGNSGRIKLAGEPMNPIAERLVNGMEALIELQRLKELAKNADSPMPTSPRDAVKRYFGLPRLDQLPSIGGEEGKQLTERVRKLRKKLTISLGFDKGSREFMVEIRDHGMGQTPSRMHGTLMSLGQTDKADKPYMIGLFGQGGSSAYAASTYSLVMSRRCPDILASGEDAGIGWTVVRKIIPKNRRDPYFAYLAASTDGAVPRFDASVADQAGFQFGSSFRHFKYDFATGGSSVARVMYQALNHVLFNPILPYELQTIEKDQPEPMMGTAQRLAQRVKRMQKNGERGTLDKSFADQAVGQ